MFGGVSFKFAHLALALAMCAGLAACAGGPRPMRTASAAPHLVHTWSAARAMPLGAPVDAPTGFISLCIRSPIDCVQADTPQARANAVLQARQIARARWRKVIDLAAGRGGARPLPVAPASLGAPGSARAAATPAARAEASEPPFAAASATTAGSDLVLNRAVWTRLEQINAYVNQSIRPASDLEAYGVSDWWAAPLSSGLAPYGDCKDYALEKRRELIASGLPPRALSIAIVRTSWGETHAVLLVSTSAGELVLDNLTGEIRPWDRAPYAWLSRQSAADPLVWLAVLDRARAADSRAPVGAAPPLSRP